MKRRAFFGIMGGAAVAGPKVAKEAVAKLPVGLSDVAMAPVPVGFGSLGKANGSDKSWVLKEIADVRRFLAGGLTEEEKEQNRRNRLYSQQSVISQSVASLVSVSGVRKLEIYRDRMEEHTRRIQESDARQRLHWLLRQDQE